MILLHFLQQAYPLALPDESGSPHGLSENIVFCQTPEPVHLALSDFIDTSALGVTIVGET